MGFLDKLKRNAGQAADKAKDVVVDNADKVDKGIEKAAEVVDDRTKGKHTTKIDKAAGKAHDLVDTLEDKSRKDK